MIVKGKNFNLRLVDEFDAEFILNIRLDTDKAKFLSSVDDDLEMQKSWIRNYKVREKNREEYYFIIEDKVGCKLGTVRIYDFKGDSFCWGSWIIIDGAPLSAGIESALLVYEYAFYVLKFNRCHFDVRKDNLKVRAFHERMGATMVCQNDLDVFYRYPKIDYELIRERYSKYLPEKVIA